MLHQLFSVDWSAWHRLDEKTREEHHREASQVLGRLFQRAERDESGAAYRLPGHKGDLMIVLVRRTPEELVDAQRAISALPLWEFLEPGYSYFSVVELSLHGAAERYRKRLEKEGLEEGSPAWDEALEKLLDKDREVQRDRLFPELPPHRYCCFYPMNKLRGEHKNWFTLTAAERGAMMAGHGKTGRKYFGKVTQIISSSMGLDDYDWGVDLFSDECVQFKKLIYEMRFDVVSAVYAEFGPFFVGVRTEPGALLA